MSESLTISRSSSPSEQRQQAVTYIRRHLQDFLFRGDKYTYLPIPFIKTIATHDNIAAVIAQDPLLAFHYDKLGIPDPSHSHDFLTNKIFKSAKRCFVSVMYASESMYFLRQLTNIIDDGNLPIEEAKIESGLAEAAQEFMAQQELFCAPIMVMGDFEQVVERVPLVGGIKKGSVQGRQVYGVEFHEGHFEEGVVKSEYNMVGFEEKEDAERSEVWKRRKMGFWWREEYFLCFK